MAGEKNAGARAERLEHVAGEVVRASAAREDEAAAAAESPFLYARVRAAIEAERRRREEGDGWLGLLAVARRAAPAMGLAAVLALGLFLSSGERPQAAGFGLGEALLAERDGDIEQVVLADAPSGDEALEGVIGLGGGAAARRREANG